MVKKVCFLIAACTMQFTGFSQGGNVGIGTTNPTAQLHTTGTVRFDHFSGHGLRLIYVDDSGALQLPRIDTFTSTAPLTPTPADCNGVTGTINVSGMSSFLPGKRFSIALNFSSWSNYTYIYLIAPGGQILNLYKPYSTTGSGQAYHTINRVIYSSKGAGETPAGSLDSVKSGPEMYIDVYDPGMGGYIPSNVPPINCNYHATIAGFSDLNGTLLDGVWTLKLIHAYPNFLENTTLANWSISVQNVDVPNPFNYINEKIGIGTANPIAPFDVISPDNTNDNIITVRANNLTQGIGFSCNKISAIGTNASVPLLLSSKNGGSLLLNAEGGNVGIGTNAPTSPLTVVSRSTSPGAVAIWSQNGTDALTIDHNSIKTGGYGYGTELSISTALNKNLLLNPSWGGNVGIGTATPTAKLDVAGTVNATSFTGSGSALSGVVTTSAPQNVFGVKTFSDSLIMNSGVKFPTAGGTPSLLNHYEQITFAVNFFNGSNTYASNYIVKAVRIGTQVTLTFPADLNTLNVSGVQVVAIAPIPARFVPQTSLFMPIPIQSNGVVSVGMAHVTSNGIGIYSGNLSGPFAGPNSGIRACSITYSVQ